MYARSLQMQANTPICQSGGAWQEARCLGVGSLVWCRCMHAASQSGVWPQYACYLCVGATLPLLERSDMLPIRPSDIY